MQKFIRILRDNRGATAIEYGLIAALIAVAAITAMTALGNQQSRNSQYFCEIFGFRLNHQSQCVGKFWVGKEFLRD